MYVYMEGSPFFFPSNPQNYACRIQATKNCLRQFFSTQRLRYCYRNVLSMNTVTLAFLHDFERSPAQTFALGRDVYLRRMTKFQ